MIASLETYFGHGISPGEAIIIALTTIPLLIGLVVWVTQSEISTFIRILCS